MKLKDAFTSITYIALVAGIFGIPLLVLIILSLICQVGFRYLSLLNIETYLNHQVQFFLNMFLFIGLSFTTLCISYMYMLEVTEEDVIKKIHKRVVEFFNKWFMPISIFLLCFGLLITLCLPKSNTIINYLVKFWINCSSFFGLAIFMTSLSYLIFKPGKYLAIAFHEKLSAKYSKNKCKKQIMYFSLFLLLVALSIIFGCLFYYVNLELIPEIIKGA